MKEPKVIRIEPSAVSPRSIQEDELPRDGGMWPDYCDTMILCVDDFAGGLARGRLYSYCCPEPKLFRSLDQMLLAMEDILDETGLVQAWEARRSLRSGKASCSQCRQQRASVPAVRVPTWEFQHLRPQRGWRTTFYLRVYARQHASMQGFLCLCGKAGTSMPFRSALELARLLLEALAEQQQDAQR